MDSLVRQDLAEAFAPLGSADAAVRVLALPAQHYVACDQPANSVQDRDGGIVLWLAPDRALQIGGTLPDGFVSDVTDGLAVFELVGPRAEEILAMGSTLDPALLAPGSCAQTLFAGLRAVLYRRDDALRCHVERPFAAYLYRWFETTLTALR